MASTAVISLYPHIKETKNSKQIPIDVFLDYIQEGKFEDYVHKVRTSPAPAEEKKKVPYVTISGVFEGRTDKGIKQHSGFIGIDIDDCDPLEVKSLLCCDPYVFSCFTSIGGKGICAIFKINPEKHREAFQGISEYLYENYRMITDPTSINQSRARFVSFDPDLFRNLNAAKFSLYPKVKERKLPTIVFAQNDFDLLISSIKDRAVNICEDYYAWVRIGFGFADKFGEAGRDYFHVVSANSGKYTPTMTDKQYTNCLKARGMKVTTIGTFYYYCKQAGLSLYSSQTKTIINSAIGAKKSGRDQISVTQLLQNFEEIPAEISAPIIDQVFSNPIEDVPEQSLIEMVREHFRHNYNIRRNEVTRYLENDGKILKQKDLNTIWADTKIVYDKVNYEIVERIINSSSTPDYNPLHEFFSRHEHINTTGHIDALFASIETDDTTFAQYFGKKWLVGSIASIYGTHNPLMLILSGSIQGSGKTQFFRRLCPGELKPYFGESKLDAGKDDEILMTQKMFIYDDEMAGKSKKEVTKMKELLSKQTFSLREPYGRNNVDLERIASLCGSTNVDDILNDPTGSRRFIPIKTYFIHFDKYNAVDKLQLFMEAYHLYKSGFEWELSRQDIERLYGNNEQFEAYSTEYELIAHYVIKPDAFNAKYVTSTEIKVEIERATGQKLMPEKIGREMTRLGFEKTTKNIDGIPRKCYKIGRIIGANGGDLRY